MIISRMQVNALSDTINRLPNIASIGIERLSHPFGAINVELFGANGDVEIIGTYSINGENDIKPGAQRRVS
jgi:hypothetical protein